MPGRIDAKDDFALGKPLPKPFDDLCCGIRRILKAEDQLNVSTIVLLAERCEIGLELGFDAVKRLENRDGRAAGTVGDAFLGKSP